MSLKYQFNAWVKSWKMWLLGEVLPLGLSKGWNVPNGNISNIFLPNILTLFLIRSKVITSEHCQNEGLWQCSSHCNKHRRATTHWPTVTLVPTAGFPAQSRTQWSTCDNKHCDYLLEPSDAIQYAQEIIMGTGRPILLSFSLCIFWPIPTHSMQNRGASGEVHWLGSHFIFHHWEQEVSTCHAISTADSICAIALACACFFGRVGISFKPFLLCARKCGRSQTTKLSAISMMSPQAGRWTKTKHMATLQVWFFTRLNFCFEIKQRATKSLNRFCSEY